VANDFNESLEGIVSMSGNVETENDPAGAKAPQGRTLKARPIIPANLLKLIHKLQKNYNFFSEMSEGEISDFLRMCKQETYEPSAVIFKEGASADHFYLIVSGEVVIEMDDKEVARLHAGEVLGEMALLENIPRTATATASETTILFFIPVRVLNTRMPTLAYKVLLGVAQQMSARLREANENIVIPKNIEENDKTADGWPK
jgi:CRP/FNR family transcriptional regulator, cyclic AMP receptor protein